MDKKGQDRVPPKTVTKICRFVEGVFEKKKGIPTHSPLPLAQPRIEG